MNPRLLTESTTFTRDVAGRYVCNTFDEAMASTMQPGARPFDLIVLGGGTFGSVLASRLFGADRAHAHRILVLEAGPLVFTEHVQNQPTLTTDEVWGVPWNSDSPKAWNRRFPGLAYCLGGRSLFWGGWSPSFVPTELRSPPWPQSVVRDLTEKVITTPDGPMSYLDLAASQIGSDEPNDFVSGTLHETLRGALFAGLRARPDGPTRLVGQRGTPMNAAQPQEELLAELEAPLAVQSKSPRPGFFPLNKFSAAQLLIRASRLAQAEAEQAAWGGFPAKDARKRLMVVPNVHVIRLEHEGRRITRIHTNRGVVHVPPEGHVLLALGTIESTRLALLSTPNLNGLIGRNLMAHLRSNLTLRIPRRRLEDLLGHELERDLQVSALFVKGIHRHDDGEPGHFHIQITASGVGELVKDSEAELFKKVPDIDLLHNFAGMTDEWVVITLRGIGEMTGDRTSGDPASRITLGGPAGDYDYDQPRALVRLEPNARDLTLWEAMDRASDDVASIFAGPSAVQYLSQAGGVWQDIPPGPDQRRDVLSSTHHEGGTLWMGTDPATSITDEWGRFQELENLHAVGPALLPTMGSPNPMLSGVALARRTADHLVSPTVNPPEAGFVYLFDGTERTFSHWRSVGRASFALVDGAIVVQPGDDLGLLYYAPRTFEDFELRMEFRILRFDDNSGVFVRFRDPARAVPDRTDELKFHRYQNPAYVAVDTGFEIQIDDLARPDDRDEHRTGAFYNVPIGSGTGTQTYSRPPKLGDSWHQLAIRVVAQDYSVAIDGRPTARFKSSDRLRGHYPYSGFVGLQAHSGSPMFRNIQVRALAAARETERKLREPALAESGRGRRAASPKEADSLPPP